MHIGWIVPCILCVMLFSSLALAAANTGGGGGGAYAGCMNGCWRSHSYCKKHQSKEIDCDHQLGQCIEWCESQHDPQGGASRGPVFPALQQRRVR